ncbi:PREDICTED: uncharacterized protein LOC108357933 [Rhagoletis zephyria]|uniref:uncharacterized protein LOC108357933 n=1 Tax=Rhagoletis zephyria TaxID=28612 RepID=UPI0008112FEB|nr:PREDICTED: uncharacterized protein LOC108357933 [Rhagoletis zephyria]
MAISLTYEQLERLMRAVPTNNDRVGIFSTCSARYNGERNPIKIEEFIAAISTFKIVEKISDADAINEMPTLLEGDAAEWWRGIKDHVTDFIDVLRKLRKCFSPPRPAWKIYAEIFELKQQKNEPTDTFIRKKRALFSQLEKAPAEAEQLDMLFGMLHAQVRERVDREKVTCYEELLNEARETEHFLSELKSANGESSIQGESVGVALRCNFCRKTGHTAENCFKKLTADAAAQSEAVARAVVAEPKFACYGCNTPGVTRANCSTCRNVKKPSHGFVYFNSLTTYGIGRDMPVVEIQIFDMPVQAFFDSGACASLASANLKAVMDLKGCKYREARCAFALADGSSSIQNCLSTVCKIKIGGRSLNAEFIVFPDAKTSRTLIGTDFLEQAGIVLNMGQRNWHFESDPTQHFDFATALPLKLNSLETEKAPKALPKRLLVEQLE